jgi:hypothetical protein
MIKELTITFNEFSKCNKEFKPYELGNGDLVHLDHPHWSGFYIIIDIYGDIITMKRLLVDSKGNPIIDKEVKKLLKSL